MKAALRTKMKQTLSAMPPEQAAARSRRACEALGGTPEFTAARSVMIYMAMPAELDCSALAQACWAAGKSVLLPRVVWEERALLALPWTSPEDRFDRGPFGIREPAGGEPVPIERIDLIVVPALAFDRRGHRLGRGGGLYDRFLADPRCRALPCGIAFAEQVLDELPRLEHDVPVRMLVTDMEVLRFGPAGQARS